MVYDSHIIFDLTTSEWQDIVNVQSPTREFIDNVFNEEQQVYNLAKVLLDTCEDTQSTKFTYLEHMLFEQTIPETKLAMNKILSYYQQWEVAFVASVNKGLEHKYFVAYY